MAESFQEEPHFDLSGGVNRSVSRLLMADNDLKVVENGESEKIGSITKVRGYSVRGASGVNPNYNILGMVNAAQSSSGAQKQIVVCDGAATSDAYTYNPVSDVWTAHGLSLSTGSKAEFESFLDGFFMVNFTEATRFNDLTQWYTTNNVTDAPKAKYIKLFLDRLYLFYVVYGGNTYTSRCVYSDLPSGPPWTLTWTNADNYFDVATDDGDQGKGLAVNSNRLLLFKHNSLFRYDTNTLYQVSGCPGTVSHRSIGNIGGHTLYLHETGIWDYNGSTSSLISRKIKEIIDGISTKNLDDACAWVKGDHYYLFVGDIFNPKTRLEIDNCLIDYDISKNNFHWRSLDDSILTSMLYPLDTSKITYNDATITYDNSNTAYNGGASAEERLFLGSSDGYVYQFENGNSYNTSDIAFSMETKDYYLGYHSFWKLIQKVNLFTDYSGKGGLVFQAKLDDNDWITLVEDDNSPGWYIFPSGSLCQRIAFRIIESSSGDRFAIEGFDIYFVPSGLIR